MTEQHRSTQRRTATIDEAPPVAKPGVGLAVVAAIACVAQFMVVLDSSIVNVALPSMKTALSLSTSSQGWIVNGYLIAFGGLLLLASRASDLFGRRRIFLAGLVVFTAASFAGGLAHDGWMLLTARVIQGAGAAALAPSSLSLITASHHHPAQRTRAMTWWGVAASSAGAAGVVLGGVLTASLSWRSVMLVNVPVGIGLLIATLTWLAPSPADTGKNSLDLPGALTITGATAAIVYAVSVAPEHGWLSVPVLAGLAAGVVLAAAFALIERWTDQPLIPSAVLAVHNVRVGNLLTLLMGVVISAPLFFLSLYLQQVLGHTALNTGLALLPMVAVISVGVLASQQLIPTIGARRLVLTGGLVAAAGLVWLSWLPTTSSYVLHVLLPTLIIGAGISVMMMPAIVAATTGVAPKNAGIASGLINTCRQLGAALGIAALITVASTITDHSNATAATATVHGYRAALLIMAAISVLTALLSQLLKTPAAATRQPS